MTSPDIIFSAKNIGLNVDGKPALEHVSFHLFRGELLCIYGTFHSGINLLSDILSGNMKAESGTMYYQGRRVEAENLPAWYISRINKESALIDNMSVAENLFVVGRNHHPFINWMKINRDSDWILDKLMPEVRAKQPVYSLDSVQKRILEIVKYATMGIRIVLIDNVVYFKENANERLYEAMRILRERGMSFIYLGQQYDYFTERANRVLALRNNHMAGGMISLRRDHEVIRRMTAINDEEAVSDNNVHIDSTESVMTYCVADRKKRHSAVLYEGEIHCILSIHAICEEIWETFSGMTSSRIGEAEAWFGDMSWKFEKNGDYRIEMVSYEYKKDVVCKELTVFQNAYLNPRIVDPASRRQINFSGDNYFSRQLDTFLGKPEGWSGKTKARELSFQEQRLILLYRAMLQRRKLTVLLFPAGDLEGIILSLKRNRMTVIVITDQLEHTGSLFDRVTEIEA